MSLQQSDQEATVSGAPARSRRARVLSGLGPRRLNAVYLLILFIIIFGIVSPRTFLSRQTLTIVLSTGAETCILALAFLVPLLTGTFDLSVGTMMTFSLTIVSELSLKTSLPIILIAVIAIICCIIVGILNGLLIVRFHVNSFIATLGMSQVLQAAVLVISNNQQLVGHFPSFWSTLGNGQIFGVLPAPFLVVLILGLILWYFFEKTRGGRYLFATGSNERAARLSGVRTSRIIWGSVITSAIIAAIAGIIYSAQIGVSSSTVGDGLLFPAIAAVFLGASQLSLRPNVWGTVIAYIALAIGVQGLSLTTGASAVWAPPLFQGVALIVAVAIASRPVIKRLRTARAERNASPVGQVSTTASGAVSD